jgi:hypothetical protein
MRNEQPVENVCWATSRRVDIAINTHLRIDSVHRLKPSMTMSWSCLCERPTCYESFSSGLNSWSSASLWSFSSSIVSHPCLNNGLTLRSKSSTISHVLSFSLDVPPSITFHPSDVTWIVNMSPSSVNNVTVSFSFIERDWYNVEYIARRWLYSCKVNDDAWSGVNSGRGMSKSEDNIQGSANAKFQFQAAN